MKPEYNVYVKTTSTCNLNCDYCYTGGRTKDIRFDPVKTSDWVKKLLTKVSRIRIKFHGGEPLYDNLVDDILLFISLLKNFRAKIDYDITTNLTYKLNDKILYLFRAYIESGIISTSWDIPYRFKTKSDLCLWESNVQELINSGLKVYVKAMMNDAVVAKSPKSLIEYFNQLGIHYLQLDSITGDNRLKNRDVDDFLVRFYEEYRCRKDLTYSCVTMDDYLSSLRLNLTYPSSCNARTCNRDNITINPDGSIAGCPDNWKNTYSHISDMDIDGIVDRKNKSLCKAINLEKMIPTGCSGCEFLSVCGAGCSRSKYDDTGCPGYYNLMRVMNQDVRREE
ncbi:hypothetical protein C3I27_04350 [Campylobacter jejuni]|uniref:Radical SAM core domain-containing protein n=1 Tax=Campylobacter jejuni TaxID=197 RepID=A0AAX1Z596_CAMJU|nr:radical SAM protein [Campylobacter jejuni]RTI48660.1 hypothetical protein C3I27_04350 [Campylobacter jejuni]